MPDPTNAPPSEKPLLLIVDDDPLIVDSLSYALGETFELIVSHSRRHAMQLARQLRRPPEIALVDLGLPPLTHRPDEGFALISELLAFSPALKIVVLSGQNDDGNARHARALGASEFAAKPCRPPELLAMLKRVLSYRALDQRQSAESESAASPLLGDSPAIAKLRIQLQRYADSPFPVLIEGESGSGKEVAASTCLDLDAKRRDKPFFALNCAAITPSLVEPTLFGYAKGAFTGAGAAKSGYFEDAADGTLFLDEIGELPLELQAKLLRVIENGEYQRVGETQLRISRARIIAATNRDLRKEVRAGRFRADLYHRLSVFTIAVPPLREMEEDRFVFFEHFSRRFATPPAPPVSLAEDARGRWRSYPFPGNVRELRNIVIRLTAKYPGERIDVAKLEDELDLMDELASAPERAIPPETAAFAPENAALPAALRRLRSAEPFNLDGLLAETEQAYIDAALQLSHGNVSQAARRLGINRTTLYNRMQSAAAARERESP